MERLFITYRLNDGVSREDFIAFSRDLDQVITPRQPGVVRLKAHLVEPETNDEPDNRPPFDVIETVDVASFDAWRKALGSDEMTIVINEFERVADQGSVRMIRVTTV